MRYESKVMKELIQECIWQHMNSEDVMVRSKRILECYKQSMWREVTDVKDEELYGKNGELNRHLMVLSDFRGEGMSPEIQKAIRKLSGYELLDQMIEAALEYMSFTMQDGDVYKTILSVTYTGNRLTKASVVELERMVHLKQTQIYNKKKEAILAFGLVFELQVLPKVRREVIETVVNG